MNTSGKKTRFHSFKKRLTLFSIIFIAVNFSIQSQNTSNTNDPPFFNEERPIKYGKLNEVSKYIEFKIQADKRDSIQKRQLAIQDSIIAAQNDIISRYENKVIPNLNHQISLLLMKEEKQNELDAIRDEKWKLEVARIKGKRLGVGGYIGYGATLDGFSIKALPSIGLSFHYTVFRL